MIPNLIMKQTFLIIHFILATIIVTYYNPRIQHLTQWYNPLYNICRNFLFCSWNIRFCPSTLSWSLFRALNWFSKNFWHLSIFKSVDIPFPFISFISLSDNVLTFNFICKVQFFSLFFYLKAQNPPVAFPQGVDLQELQFLFW